MEEWGILGQALVSDSRVEGEEKRRRRKSRTKVISFWTFNFFSCMWKGKFVNIAEY